ncbi:MAG TPA: hypothetical protein VIK14_16135 [Ignavibacteria bacterium]
MKKKYITMLISTLIIGSVIGTLTSGIFFNKRSNHLIVAPTTDYFKQKVINLLKPDEEQLKLFDNSLNKFSDRAYLIEKDNNDKMYNTLDSLYIELKPALTPEQKDKLEKKIIYIYSIIEK